MACYAPVKDEETSGSENKKKAAGFYKMRNVLRDIYPLEWLNTDNSF